MPYTNKAFRAEPSGSAGYPCPAIRARPPRLETCQVLELSCAEGDNLIPMALAMPNAHFVGIDLSRTQIERGQRVAESLGRTNIELRAHDIADVDAAFGTFDYIVCHGIYSWVPAPVRDKAAAPGTATPADDENLLGGQLLQGYGIGAIDLRTGQPALARAPSARPIASPLARLQAKRGHTVTNMRNDLVHLSELLHRIVPLLDGTRDVDALVTGMVRLAMSGAMEVREEEGGAPLRDRSALQHLLRDAVERDLTALARAGLLVA